MRNIVGYRVAVLVFTCSILAPHAAKSSDQLPKPEQTVGTATDIHTKLEALAKEIARLSPPAAKNDEAARDAAAKGLRESALMDQLTPNLIGWGQYGGKSYDPAKNTLTDFNSLVWRTMYLSLFTFTGEHTILTDGKYTVLSMDVVFRNELGDGAYPYPFWHKAGKWAAYQKAKNILLIFENGVLVAGYRGAMDETRAASEKTFNGNWQWKDDHDHLQPFSSLYEYLLSGDNPHKKDLDTAYRAFALEARNTSCLECHAPDNTAKMDRLSILNLPGQALSHRHQILDELEENAMPPKKDGHPAGIKDPNQRKSLLELAKTFAEVGDKALEFEKGHRAAVVETEEASQTAAKK
jgi:hypothetical protein